MCNPWPALTPDGIMLQSEVAYEYFRDRFSVTSQQPCSQARLDCR